MRESYSGSITKLKSNEIMVFGANNYGFHGAGAAGFASFGRWGNVWREEGYADKPDGWKGKWNVKGQAEGLQEGTEGKSYALPTVMRPGKKRSLSMAQIVKNIRKMYALAKKMPDHRFLVAGSSEGSPPLNGYTHEEMVQMFVEAGKVPGNVVFSDSYSALIFKDEGKPSPGSKEG